MRLPTTIEMEILGLLIAGREMYGLEMVKKSNALKRGTIYVTLSRMQDKGLVTARPMEDAKQPGMPRQLYRITGLGQKLYQHAMDLREPQQGLIGGALA